MIKIFIGLGSIIAFLGVALGAFGAHSLNLSGKWKDVYETGVQYHLIHALGLIFIGMLADKFSGGMLFHWSGWLMVLGIVLFSGSLYMLSITEVGVLGAITPIGGVAFLLGWLLLIIAVFKG